MEGRSRTRGQYLLCAQGQTPFPHRQASGSDGPHVWAASQRTLQQKRPSRPFTRIYDIGGYRSVTRVVAGALDMRKLPLSSSGKSWPNATEGMEKANIYIGAQPGQITGGS